MLAASYILKHYFFSSVVHFIFSGKRWILCRLFFFFKFKPAKLPGKVDAERTDRNLPVGVDCKVWAKQFCFLCEIVGKRIGGSNCQASLLVPKLFTNGNAVC